MLQKIRAAVDTRVSDGDLQIIARTDAHAVHRGTGAARLNGPQAFFEAGADLVIRGGAGRTPDGVAAHPGGEMPVTARREHRLRRPARPRSRPRATLREMGFSYRPLRECRPPGGAEGHHYEVLECPPSRGLAWRSCRRIGSPPSKSVRSAVSKHDWDRASTSRYRSPRDRTSP